MSQGALRRRSIPGPSPLRTQAQPPLRVVAGGSATRRAWLAIGSGLTLIVGLIAALMINTALAEGSYELAALEQRANELAVQQEGLTHDLDGLRAPATLARRAMELGMVPAGSPAFIRLADGKVLGEAKAANRTSGFTVVTSPAGNEP